MSHETVAVLFGLALFGGWIVCLSSLFVARVRDTLTAYAVPIAAAVATGATLGSLYFSERAGFVPCELCWYQRIAMYPLAVILVAASIRRDRSIFRYALLLAGGGIAVSAYHVWIQLFPEESNFCEISNPCSAKWVDAFGWLTIPQMAGLSFGLILFVGILNLRSSES